MDISSVSGCLAEVHVFGLASDIPCSLFSSQTLVDVIMLHRPNVSGEPQEWLCMACGQ
jgi:hypothetical protein